MLTICPEFFHPFALFYVYYFHVTTKTSAGVCCAFVCTVIPVSMSTIICLHTYMVHIITAQVLLFGHYTQNRHTVSTDAIFVMILMGFTRYTAINTHYIWFTNLATDTELLSILEAINFDFIIYIKQTRSWNAAYGTSLLSPPPPAEQRILNRKYNSFYWNEKGEQMSGRNG